MPKPDPRLNASLIREGRMIFQQLSQLFGNTSKIDNVYAMRAAQAQADADIAKAKAAAVAPALKCCVCIAAGGTTTPKEAVTIAKGDALCVQHLVAANLDR